MNVPEIPVGVFTVGRLVCYETAPEGNYNAEYKLKTENHNLTGVMLLDAKTEGETLANATVDACSLPDGRLQDIILEFSNDAVSTDLKLRGIPLSGYTHVRLDRVRLTHR